MYRASSLAFINATFPIPNVTAKRNKFPLIITRFITNKIFVDEFKSRRWHWKRIKINQGSTKPIMSNQVIIQAYLKQKIATVSLNKNLEQIQSLLTKHWSNSYRIYFRKQWVIKLRKNSSMNIHIKRYICHRLILTNFSIEACQLSAMLCIAYRDRSKQYNDKMLLNSKLRFIVFPARAMATRNARFEPKQCKRSSLL